MSEWNRDTVGRAARLPPRCSPSSSSSRTMTSFRANEPLARIGSNLQRVDCGGCSRMSVDAERCFGDVCVGVCVCVCEGWWRSRYSVAGGAHHLKQLLLLPSLRWLRYPSNLPLSRKSGSCHYQPPPIRAMKCTAPPTIVSKSIKVDGQRRPAQPTANTRSGHCTTQ